MAIHEANVTTRLKEKQSLSRSNATDCPTTPELAVLRRKFDDLHFLIAHATESVYGGPISEGERALFRAVKAASDALGDEFGGTDNEMLIRRISDIAELVLCAVGGDHDIQGIGVICVDQLNHVREAVGLPPRTVSGDPEAIMQEMDREAEAASKDRITDADNKAILSEAVDAVREQPALVSAASGASVTPGKAGGDTWEGAFASPYVAEVVSRLSVLASRLESDDFIDNEGFINADVQLAYRMLAEEAEKITRHVWGEHTVDETTRAMHDVAMAADSIKDLSALINKMPVGKFNDRCAIDRVVGSLIDDMRQALGEEGNDAQPVASPAASYCGPICDEIQAILYRACEPDSPAVLVNALFQTINTTLDRMREDPMRENIEGEIDADLIDAIGMVRSELREIAHYVLATGGKVRDLGSVEDVFMRSLNALRGLLGLPQRDAGPPEVWLKSSPTTQTPQAPKQADKPSEAAAAKLTQDLQKASDACDEVQRLLFASCDVETPARAVQELFGRIEASLKELLHLSPTDNRQALQLDQADPYRDYAQEDALCGLYGEMRILANLVRSGTDDDNHVDDLISVENLFMRALNAYRTRLGIPTREPGSIDAPASALAAAA